MTRRQLDFSREKQILINLITNTDYCREVLPFVEDSYFKSTFAKTIIVWVREYYKQYEKAPNYQIKDIYESEAAYTAPDIAEQIGDMLEHLSDIADTENHNTEYLIDKAIEFFDERHTTLQLEAAQHYMSQGQVSKAKEALGKSLELKSASFEWVNFSDEDFVRKCTRQMIQQQDLDSAFFAFDGRLGEFIGPIDRGWFIAFMAPAKRGKTTYLMETVVTAIRRRLNVVVLSLEMPIHQLYKRYLLYVVGNKPESGARTIDVPIFDCAHNQDGSCELKQRVGWGTALETDGSVLTYTDIPDWQICTECRGTKEFKPATWLVPVDKPEIREGAYVKKAMRFNKYFGKYCRAIHIPSKSATTGDLRTEMKLLEQRENFVPDVVVIDYADLIKPDVSSGQKRHDLDEIWEQLRAWGQTDRVLLVSASQTNRISADAAYVRDTHVAEDYSKIAKLDIAIGLCQTDIMKERGMMNLNKVAHRHEEYVQSHVCTVLQELSHQQPALDSEFAFM